MPSVCSLTTTVFESVLFYSNLGCVLPLQEVALRHPPTFSVLCQTAPCCPTISSLQRRFGLPTHRTPSVCHSVLLIVHLLSFIRAMCPAHFHFVLVRVTSLRFCWDFGWLVGWLLIVPATCECISGTDLLRQFNVLPH